VLVDTAGIRRKARVKEDLEFYSVLRSLRAIEDADVCLFMIDATSGINAQDLAIFHLIEKNRKGVVIIVNKWDLMEKDQDSVKKFTEMINEKIVPFTDVPIIFTSVKTKQRIQKTLETAVEVFRHRTEKIPTSKLNEVLLPIIERTPPPATKGKYIKIKYVTQLPTHTPQFAFFCNLPQYISESYTRFIENQMREHFPLSGVPIEIYFRSKVKEEE
jgi:GTP-binding protein